MKLEEVWTFDISMREMGLGYHGIGIGHNGPKALDHCVGCFLVGFVCSWRFDR